MTPLNIGLAVAVLVLIALLWKMRHDRAERDADFDDRPIGSWAAHPAAEAPRTEAPAGAAQGAAGVRAPAGSSWVVGGGGMDADGWPAGPVTDPGWPHPGQMSSAWPAAGGPDPGVSRGANPDVPAVGAIAEAVPEWERTAPDGATEDRPTADVPEILSGGAGGAGDAPVAMAQEAPAALPVWNPLPASPTATVDPDPSPREPAPDPEAEVGDAGAWPTWESSGMSQDPSPAPPQWRPDAAAAPAPPVVDGGGGTGPWDDVAVPALRWSDETDLALAQHAATALDGGTAAAPADGPDSGRGRFALGGHAMRAGQHAVSGVTFRDPIGVPPSAWAVAPAPGAAPGTLVLHLDGAVNCGVEGLAVVMDAGFAPTDEGFTVRVAAREPGPFIASGTFEIAL